MGTYHQMMAVRSPGKRVEIRDPRQFSMNTMIWCLVMVSAVAMLAMMVLVFSRCTKHKETKERASSEVTPLVHSKKSGLHGVHGDHGAQRTFYELRHGSY